MNFSKNPFIGANKVSTTNSIKNPNLMNRVNTNDIKETMMQTTFQNKQKERELVKQKDEALKKQHEAFADRHSQYNSSQNIARNNNVQAQNKLLRGFKNGN